MGDGKRTRSWNTYVIAIGWTVFGFVLLLVSRHITESASHEWWAGVLSNAGTAVIFVVPLYLITRRLDRHVEAVRAEGAESVEAVRVEAAQGVEALAERVSDFQVDVDRRLEDVARSVASRLREEQQVDAEAFDALAAEPSRTNVLRALAVAFDQGLIKGAPRVRVSTTENLFVAFQLEEDDDLWLNIQSLNGSLVDCVEWPNEESVDDVMFTLGRAIQAKTGPSEVLDVGALFTGLVDLLRVATSSPKRRPLFQLCPPQWAVTEGGVVSYGPGIPLFEIPADEVRGAWRPPMTHKPWVDIGSLDAAALAAVSLFPERDPSEPF